MKVKIDDDRGEIDKETLEVMDWFLRGILAQQIQFLSVKNIKFVFSDNDIEKMHALLSKSGKEINYDLTAGLMKMKQIITNENESEDNVYIRVRDFRKFFELLSEIKRNQTYYAISHGGIGGDELLKTIWLRMGPEDTNDVFSFLERQLSFIENDCFFSSQITPLNSDEDFAVYYINQTNGSCFETNMHISFYLQPVNNGDRKYHAPMFCLPSIHYGLATENEKKVCYIYGIQTLENYNPQITCSWDEGAQKKFEIICKKDRYLPHFVMALKLFLELLAKSGITSIRVPLIQVFNYDYHVQISESSKRQYETYGSDPNKYYTMMMGSAPYDILKSTYEAISAQYNRFYNKQDLISANKTERLINIFRHLENCQVGVSILNEPFRQGDSLIVQLNSDTPNHNHGRRI